MLVPMLSRLFTLLIFFVAPLFAAPGTLFSQTNPEWTTPFPPHRIIGNVYYVGSKDLAAFLITTPQGHILINSNLESSPSQIKKSVEQLGFRFSDISSATRTWIIAPEAP
jgi:metallo-beta-lactamase class B